MSRFVPLALLVALLTGCTVSSTRHPATFSSEILRPSALVAASAKASVMVATTAISAAECERVRTELMQRYRKAVVSTHPDCLTSFSPQCNEITNRFLQSSTYLSELSSKQHRCAMERSPLGQGNIRELSVHYLENALKAYSNLTVYDAEFSRGRAAAGPRSYRLQIETAEYVADIELRANRSDSVFRDAGFIASEASAILISSAGVLGPIGSVLQSFDVITGIPVSWHTNKRDGLVSMQVSVIDTNSGEVLTSFVTEDKVPRRFSQVGSDDMGSGSAKKEDPMPEEALRLLSEKVAQRIAALLEERAA